MHCPYGWRRPKVLVPFPDGGRYVNRACRESESMIWDSNLVAIFLERPREKVDSNLFFKWFANLSLNKKLWIFDSRIIVDSNQDSNQILNWFATHESEIFDSRQALTSMNVLIGNLVSRFLILESPALVVFDFRFFCEILVMWNFFSIFIRKIGHATNFFAFPAKKWSCYKFFLFFLRKIGLAANILDFLVKMQKSNDVL